MTKVICFSHPSLRWWTNCKERKYIRLSLAHKAALSCPAASWIQPCRPVTALAWIIFTCARVRHSVIPALMGMRDGSYEVGQTKGSLLCQYSAISSDYLQSALQQGFDAVLNRVNVWSNVKIASLQKRCEHPASCIPQSCPESNKTAGFPSSETGSLPIKETLIYKVVLIWVSQVVLFPPKTNYFCHLFFPVI